jgi:hypothetical protein
MAVVRRVPASQRGSMSAGAASTGYDVLPRGHTMTKSKASLIGLSTFVITTAIMIGLCANAHIDFFPCEKTVRDRAHADPFTGEAKLITQDGTCSLMGHLREPFDGEKEVLTGAGWAMLAAFCVSIGAADGALIYVLLSRKASDSKTA